MHVGPRKFRLLYFLQAVWRLRYEMFWTCFPPDDLMSALVITGFVNSISTKALAYYALFVSCPLALVLELSWMNCPIGAGMVWMDASVQSSDGRLGRRTRSGAEGMQALLGSQ